MRPLAVATDVDGTLAGADHQVSRRTQEVVRRLGVRGIPVLLVTGRTELATLRLARLMALTAPVISCNGAVVTDPVTEDRLQVQPMAAAAARAACATAERSGLNPVLFTLDGLWAAHRSAETEVLATLLAEPVRVGPLAPVIASSTVVKLMIGGDPSALDDASPDLRRAIPGLERSMPQFLEAAPTGASKRESLSWVLDRLGIPLRSCVGFGDGGNDVQWLASVGRPVAMANARPAVLAVADEVIGHHAQEAVADYLERMFLTATDSGTNT
ncbi:MAG: HAD family hydrolase [Propioniciclava sp.]